MPATNHGFAAQACRSRGACPRQAVTGAEFSEATGEILQRHRPGRHRAAVDGADLLSQDGAGEIFQHGMDLLLHRMFGTEIFVPLDAHRASEAEKAGVLAGAIVV